MRIATNDALDEERALATIAAAARAGVTVFDTARAYGPGPADLGHNERFIARAVRLCGLDGNARIVSKGGMTRSGGRWIPDARAKALRSDCEASLEALDGLPIDLYLIHAPDPRTPWQTSVRALAGLVDEGLVKRVGLSNVNLLQLDQAIDLAPIAAVEVAMSLFDDGAIRGGILERCTNAGLTLIAHSPLGGPRRASRLSHDEGLAEVGMAHGASAAEVALAWLLQLSPVVVVIPGARRPASAISAARAATLRLDPGAAARLGRAFGQPSARPITRTKPGVGEEVVLVMGVPGAGKSRVATGYTDRGYRRLNRDERGGSLRGLAVTLEEYLAAGDRRVVLDNTYLTRAARSYVIEAAGRHGLPTRCVWLDTPLAHAQVNMVERLLARFGSLPTPEELAGLARREPGLLLPTSQMRAFRELEAPTVDEGLASVERVRFVRIPLPGRARRGVIVAASALNGTGWETALAGADPNAPHLVFDWRPGGAGRALAEAVARLWGRVSGALEGALCAHPAGPPNCWCRPPLPGLPLAFAQTHGVDLDGPVRSRADLP